MRRVARTAPRRGSLVVVGTGISGAGQTTLEAVACMKRAQKLFYLVGDPITEFWIQQLNATATSLHHLYGEGKRRSTTYREMTQCAVSAVREGLDVCMAFYGHPGVLVQASHAAIRRVRREGYPARMLPGISTEMCLVADLGINPGDHGWQSFEATDFLLSRREVDPTSSLILWQVGALGDISWRADLACRPERLATLAKRLRRQYPARHRVVLYEAAMFPTARPKARRVTLARLPKTTIVPITTMYVPPLRQRRQDPAIRRWCEES